MTTHLLHTFLFYTASSSLPPVTNLHTTTAKHLTYISPEQHFTQLLHTHFYITFTHSPTHSLALLSCFISHTALSHTHTHTRAHARTDILQQLSHGSTEPFLHATAAPLTAKLWTIVSNIFRARPILITQANHVVSLRLALSHRPMHTALSWWRFPESKQLAESWGWGVCAGRSIAAGS